MALFVKTLLVRSNSGVDQEQIKSFAFSWLGAFDAKDPDNEFFAFVLDLKHRQFLLAFSPAAVERYEISDADSYALILDFGKPVLTEADVLRLIDERIPYEHSHIDVDLPDNFLSLVAEKVADGIDVEPIKEEVLARKNRELNIQPSDIASQVQSDLVQALAGSIDIRQAQFDLVSYGKVLLEAQLEPIQNAAQIEAFRNVLGTLTTQNAELVNALANQDLVKLTLL